MNFITGKRMEKVSRKYNYDKEVLVLIVFDKGGSWKKSLNS